MLRLSWRDKVRNEVVLQRMGKKQKTTKKKVRLPWPYKAKNINYTGIRYKDKEIQERCTSWLKNVRQRLQQ